MNQLINQWVNESMKQWTNGWMIQWTIESLIRRWINEAVNQWINESFNQWTTEPLKQRFSKSMNECMYESLNEWMNEWVSEWMKEGRSEWTNERVDGWTDGWMDGWMHGWIGGWMNGWASYFSLLSYVFSQQPLRWLLSAISLLWAATYMWSFVASATQFFTSRSQHGAFCKSSCNPAKHKSSKIGEKLPFAQLWNAFIQLQSRLPGASQHHSSFAGAAVPMRFVTTADCKPAKQERRTEIDQRSCSAGTGNSTIRRSPNMPCSYDFMWKPNSRYSVRCTFCRQLLQIEARTRGNRDPTSATPGATFEKIHGFAPKSVFTREFRHSRVATHSNCLDDGWLTWWCGWHDDGWLDGGNANQDNCP